MKKYNIDTATTVIAKPIAVRYLSDFTALPFDMRSSTRLRLSKAANDAAI